MQSFRDLKLKPAISQALQELGFETPTPIQMKALPVLLGGETDYLGIAATGTGKTAAFGIPLLQKLDSLVGLQALILCPTRELAQQTARQLTLLGKYLPLQVPAIYGGSWYGKQIADLRTAPVVVATPGRLIDHLEQGNVSLAGLKVLVLDEADKMISMGFKEDIDRICKTISRLQCRTWLFSATMPKYLKRIADEYLATAPTAELIDRKDMLPGTVRQIYYTVREKNKLKGLCKLIEMSDDFYGVVFCETKALVTTLTQFLRSKRYQVDCLHGDKDQRERERTLALFRERKVNLLVCTDVAARGLDVQDLTHVINYSLPWDPESYIHRIGRTGRNGKEGIAMSLATPNQMGVIARIEKMTGTRWEKSVFPTAKQVSAKRLARYLPGFESVAGHERASEVLDEAWLSRLEGLSKREIASRFLALALPELFIAEVEAEEVLSEPEAMPERKKPFVPRHHGAGGRPFHGKKRFFEKRDGGARPPWKKKRFVRPGSPPPSPRPQAAASGKDVKVLAVSLP